MGSVEKCRVLGAKVSGIAISAFSFSGSCTAEALVAARQNSRVFIVLIVLIVFIVVLVFIVFEVVVVAGNYWSWLARG